eukprot:UN06590
MTDVARRFPDRARDDGKHYVIDFTADEIARLALHERLNPATGEPRYPQRFPAQLELFRIPRLEEMLNIVQGLNVSGRREMGVYVEIKAPDWHAQHNLDIAAIVINALHDQGYQNERDRVFIQCFDAPTLRRVHRQALTQLPLP